MPDCLGCLRVRRDHWWMRDSAHPERFLCPGHLNAQFPQDDYRKTPQHRQAYGAGFSRAEIKQARRDLEAAGIPLEDGIGAVEPRVETFDPWGGIDAALDAGTDPYAAQWRSYGETSVAVIGEAGRKRRDAQREAHRRHEQTRPKRDRAAQMRDYRARKKQQDDKAA